MGELLRESRDQGERSGRSVKRSLLTSSQCFVLRHNTLAAATWTVEVVAREAGPGDLGPVLAAARSVRGVPPLLEEHAESGPARAGLHRQPLPEDRLELALGDAAPAVGALDLLQRAGEVVVPQDLTQCDVADSRPVVGR